MQYHAIETKRIKRKIYFSGFSNKEDAQKVLLHRSIEPPFPVAPELVDPLLKAVDTARRRCMRSLPDTPVLTKIMSAS